MTTALFNKTRFNALAVAVLLACVNARAQTQNTTITYAYDNNSNVTQIKDALGNITDQKYDALNRMYQQTLPVPATGVARPVIIYTYDGLDQLVSVQDPRNLTTVYTVDGLGNQTVVSSPDTGITNKTYDAAGNLKTSQDAKKQTTVYDYDVLNRVSKISYADGTNTVFEYDQGQYGIGRLTKVTDGSGITRYAYDIYGHLLSETRTIDSIDYVTGYGYDTYGRLSSITYPSGRVLSYTLDTMGRISQIDTIKDGDTRTLVSQVTYHPFGGVKSFVNGANVTVTRSMDLDGRINGYSLASSVQSVVYDAASRITNINDSVSTAASQVYGYDGLSRLTNYTGSGAGQTLTYDGTGNRTSKSVGSSSSSYTIDPASNRLKQINGDSYQSYLYDLNGSTTNIGSTQFNYDARGRLTSVTTGQGTVLYRINAFGQRIQKAASGTTTIFHYDSAGHLIGERTGTAGKEYVYLGDIPVAMLQ